VDFHPSDGFFSHNLTILPFNPIPVKAGGDTATAFAVTPGLHKLKPAFVRESPVAGRTCLQKALSPLGSVNRDKSGVCEAHKKGRSF